ncbi:hypothetical protein ACNRDB_01215 [Ralstonia pseudosolanacearum]
MVAKGSMLAPSPPFFVNGWKSFRGRRRFSGDPAPADLAAGRPRQPAALLFNRPLRKEKQSFAPDLRIRWGWIYRLRRFVFDYVVDYILGGTLILLWAGKLYFVSLIMILK